MSSTKKQLHDEKIIDMYFDRNEKAISETDKKYGTYLCTLGMNILNNREDTEECVNDTYIQTWNSIPPNRPRIFKAFLSKIMRNLSLDKLEYYKAKKRVPQNVVDSLSDYANIASGSTLDEDYESWLIGKIINKYLESAPDRKVYIFMSKYFFFMPTEEIAKKMDCSRTTVERELAQIREELKNVLEAQGINI